MTWTSPLSALSERVIGAAIEVHRHLGPGLLESVYADCLCEELRLAGLLAEREVALPLEYKGVRLARTLRLDLLVENQLIIETKAVSTLEPVHTAQLLTYLRLANQPLGLLLNFNVPALRQGIKRVVNQLPE
ncbi:GxxExxY protein [Niveibacterium sp. 24ML]|uniref:GxxExxY protein n=1 Tax=Niveibacterium sp. 24ML TaxID=2985512 RepID=UPI002271BB18|nr:GxxExxY protein [Niveibacterium sp. 24ML]MCX9157111.1 GxxExxY protein [Niveibacterium sp. 24ML]